MNIQYFEQFLSGGPLIEDPASFWDAKAKDFYLSQQDSGAVPPKPVTLLNERGVLRKDGTALDIGAGAGRHSRYLADIFSRVTVTDISDGMLKYARKNLEEQGKHNGDYLNLDWESADLMELGWENKFDFVFASMCPAVRSAAGLIKMSRASRFACAVTQFVQINDSLSAYITKAAELSPSELPGNNREAAWGLFSIIWALGYLPEIVYVRDTDERELTVDQAIKNSSPRLGGPVRAKGLDLAEIITSAAKDGKIFVTNDTTLALIYWTK